MEGMKSAAIVMSALKDEAEAIENYSKQLGEIAEDSGVIYEQAKAIYDEVIADELNHVSRFAELYGSITGIVPKED